MLQTTLAIMLKNGKIFLGEKKRGFAKGVLNGVGGKQEGCETMEECMIRETKEEIGINILTQEKVGVLHFYFEAENLDNLTVHLFKINSWVGEIIETDEMKPFWFDIDKIPYEKMWEDDKIWLPRILAGEKSIEYNFYFDENVKLEKYEILS